MTPSSALGLVSGSGHVIWCVLKRWFTGSRAWIISGSVSMNGAITEVYLTSGETNAASATLTKVT